MGITAGDVRKQVWSRFAKVNSAEMEPLPRTLKDELSVAISAEIEAGEKRHLFQTSADISPSVISQILVAFAEKNRVDKHQQGSAHLVAILLEMLGNQKATSGVLQHLQDKSQAFRSNEGRQLRNDCLVLADVMSEELPELCTHLNSCGFDVVDLVDVLTAWTASFFAGYFPSLAVTRMLDIFLYDGCQSWAGFVYGFFKVFAARLCEVDVGDLYRTITTVLPQDMTERQINEALRYGFETFRNSPKRIADLRFEKDWSATVSVPGPVRFQRNIGHAQTPHEKDMDLSFTSDPAVEAKQGAGPEDAAGMRIVLDKSGSAGAAVDSEVVQRLEKTKLATLDQNLRRLLEDAQRELRRQGDTLVALQSEMKHRAGDNHGNELSVSSGADSSMASVESSKLQRPEHSDDEEADARQHGLGVKKESNAKGFVPYSRLFQYQQFPCLYMEGYLLKARKPGGFFKRASGIFGNVHRRFFILQGSFLTYFKSHRHNKPSKDLSVDMRGRRITRLDTHKFGKYGFEISERGGDTSLFLLFASSSEERNVWVQVLNAASEA